jgi:hypothetical protein
VLLVSTSDPFYLAESAKRTISFHVEIFPLEENVSTMIEWRQHIYTHIFQSIYTRLIMFNIVLNEFIESQAGDPTLRAFPLVDPIFDHFECFIDATVLGIANYVAGYLSLSETLCHIICVSDKDRQR